MIAFRTFRFVCCTIALAAGTFAAATAATPSFDPDDVVQPAFPARPASVRELPPSRVRIMADFTRGVADPRAVAAFKAGRLGIALRSGLFGSNTVVHAGQGFYLDGTSSDSYGVYANHTVYPSMREPGNPDGAGFLYAPTFFGPGADCIEAVTVVQNSEPQVWAWDWCAADPDPYAIVDVDKTFKKNYIRLMPDGYPEYTVETILASDGVTWDMNLYNYKTMQWDVIYQTSGARNPNYGLGQQGWNFFETYTNVTNGKSDVCKKFKGPIVADQISIASQPSGEDFTLVTPSDSSPLKFSSFYCSHFDFTVPNANWEWAMLYT